ncbi:MAG TPA: divalent-cation tolerance protein CutA [Chthoniobacterales bacterium]|nr:divalent-cation tolerance protein CutA [Chthoniobacterales bacterium]
MAADVLLALSTFPDAETARRIARELVTERVTACANVLPAIQSVYRWEGEVQEAEETLVLFKTTRARFPELQTRLQSLHPYDVPEIIALEVVDGLPDYLRWLVESCA